MKSKLVPFDSLFRVLLYFLLLAPLCAAADNHLSVRDEWQPIDRIVVATDPATKTLYSFTENVVREAINDGVRVVIVDANPKSQEAIIKSLEAQGFINADTRKYIQFTDSTHNTGFARDEAPILTFDANSKAGVLTGTTHLKETDTNKIITDIGEQLKLGTKPVPSVELPEGFPRRSLPLEIDGGDWMTTDNGKTLITTTDLYEKNGGSAAEIKIAVDKALRTFFGITKVVALKPLDMTSTEYALTNAHVDLQVRTLPDKKVVVASVPKGDSQHKILEDNAKTLMEAGYTVIRVPNAPPGTSKLFKTYTNALFLNNRLVVPSYKNPASDAAAEKAYDEALNGVLPADSKARRKISLVDASLIIQGCGAARCVARELHRTPSALKHKEAGTRSPDVSFDAATGTLSFGQDVVNFLGTPGALVSDPQFDSDPLWGAMFEIGDMTLSPGMSVSGRFAFVGGNVRMVNGGIELFRASIPVFSINADGPGGFPTMWGVLHDTLMADLGISPWLDAFRSEVLNSPPLLPDFYMSSDFDLIALSNGFTQDFTGVRLSAAGVAGNGNSVPAPGTLVLVSLVLVCWGAVLAVRHPTLITGRQPTA